MTTYWWQNRTDLADLPWDTRWTEAVERERLAAQVRVIEVAWRGWEEAVRAKEVKP